MDTSQEESDNRTKKRRVGEDSSSDVLSLESGNYNASVAERVIEPTLVMFEVYVRLSYMLDGVHSQRLFERLYHFEEMGLVAVDKKNTVAISASDVMLSFAAFPIEIPGEV